MKVLGKSAVKGMRIRLILIVLFIVLLGVVSFINISISYYQSNMERTASQLINSNLKQAGNQIESIYLDMLKLSNIISIDETFQKMLKPLSGTEKMNSHFQMREYSEYAMDDYYRLSRINDRLKYYQSNYLFNYSSHVTVITADGLVCSFVPREANVEDATVREYYRRLKKQDWYLRFLAENDEISWLAPFSYFSEENSPQYLTLVTKIKDGYREDTAALLMINIDLEALRCIFEEFPADTYLFDSEDRLIFSHSGQRLSMGEETSYQQILKETSSYIVHPYSFQRFGLKMIAVMQSYNELLTEIQTFKRTYLVLSISIFGSAAVFMVLMILRFTRPLARMVERLRAGEYGIFNLDKTPQDEFEGIISGFDTMFRNINDLHERMLMEQRTEYQLKYDMLKAQINPHFLFNTLNVIKWTAVMNGDSKVPEMLADLGSLLEASINRETEEITIREELALLECYMKIQNARFDGAYDFHGKCQPEAEEYLIIKLLLQPIVENSIVHGFRQEQEKKKISVTVSAEGGEVFVAVEDNGCGMSSDKIEEILTEGEKRGNRFNGIGLANIDQRLRLKYGDTYGLQIFSDGANGTRILLHFPAQLQGEARESGEWLPGNRNDGQ